MVALLKQKSRLHTFLYNNLPSERLVETSVLRPLLYWDDTLIARRFPWRWANSLWQDYPLLCDTLSMVTNTQVSYLNFFSVELPYPTNKAPDLQYYNESTAKLVGLVNDSTTEHHIGSVLRLALESRHGITLNQIVEHSLLQELRTNFDAYMGQPLAQVFGSTYGRGCAKELWEHVWYSIREPLVLYYGLEIARASYASLWLQPVLDLTTYCTPFARMKSVETPREVGWILFCT